MMKFKDLMSLLTGQKDEPSDVSYDVAKLEAQEALRALDVVSCVEVSHEVAWELGAFGETALILDDIIDDHEAALKEGVFHQNALILDDILDDED